MTTEENKQFPRLGADLSLLMVTLIWGLTFVTVKNAIEHLAPYSFNFFRFSLATAFMLVISWHRRHLLSKELLVKGAILGIFLFAGYSFQTIGLMYTSASNAGFITGLAVVLVPLITALISKQLPSLFVALGVTSATIGLGLLSIGDQFTFNPGDLLVLCCALSFALHIIFVGRYTSSYETCWLVTVQIATVAFLSGAFAFVTEPKPAPFTGDIWMALFITAIPATCLAFLIQNYMQRFTTPTRTAIIFSMEPVFAAFFAVLLLQEILTSRAWWGGTLVVAGMLLSELKLSFGNPKQEPGEIAGK